MTIVLSSIENKGKSEDIMRIPLDYKPIS